MARVRIVGANFPSSLLHGTTAKSARAFIDGRDLPERERSTTLSEFGSGVLYASEHSAPHQAVMFGTRAGRTMIEMRLRDGTRILDVADEMQRRAAVEDTSPVLKIRGKPTFADDMARWIADAREKAGRPPLSAERLRSAVDPEHPDFSHKEFAGLLPGYALARGFDAIRFTDETVIVNRGAIVGARRLAAKEIAALNGPRPGARRGALYTDEFDGPVQRGPRGGLYIVTPNGNRFYITSHDGETKIRRAD